MPGAVNSKPACRAVVLISGSGSNLQTLIDGQQAGRLPISIEAVISNHAGEVKHRAISKKRLNILFKTYLTDPV